MFPVDRTRYITAALEGGGFVGRVRVMLVDDHEGYRSLLRSLLQRDPDVRVVAEAPDGERAVAIAADVCPDVAIVDLSMPGIDGHETAARLRSRCDNIAVLMLSVRSSAAEAPATGRPGAHAHLSKAEPVSAVLSAIKAYAGGVRGTGPRLRPSP